MVAATLCRMQTASGTSRPARGLGYGEPAGEPKTPLPRACGRRFRAAAARHAAVNALTFVAFWGVPLVVYVEAMHGKRMRKRWCGVGRHQRVRLCGRRPATACYAYNLHAWGLASDDTLASGCWMAFFLPKSVLGILVVCLLMYVALACRARRPAPRPRRCVALARRRDEAAGAGAVEAGRPTPARPRATTTRTTMRCCGRRRACTSLREPRCLSCSTRCCSRSS